MIIQTKDWYIVSWSEQFWEMLMSDWKREIKKRYRKRTNDQNSYLHSLFSNIAKDVWEEPDYIKRYFKDRYLKWVSKNKWIEYIRETSKLTTIEFNEFVEKVLNNIAEFGFTYPTPEEWKNWKSFND